MKLKLLALLAYGAYEYDKKQLREGKPSMFPALHNLLGNTPQPEKTQLPY